MMTPTNMPAEMPKKFSTMMRAASALATSILCGFMLLDQGLALAQSAPSGGAPNAADPAMPPAAGSDAGAPTRSMRKKLPANAVQVSDSTARVGNDVFLPDVPNHHLVVKGDTLWDISAKYLKSPWLWPQIWKMNKEQIRNPHWIYPGQMIYLDKVHGTMSLSPPDADGNTVTLTPSIRTSNDLDGISSIPQSVIEPFLTRPLIIDSDTMDKAPRVISGQGRIAMATGDTIYVAGIGVNYANNYNIYRPGVAVKDPDTGEIIGYQAEEVGMAELVKKGSPATLIVRKFSQEISVGDRLAPTKPARLINYVPHAPEKAVRGRIALVYGGLAYAGRNMVVAINRGSADGLEIGHVLAAQTLGETIIDTTGPKKRKVKLPDEKNGEIFIFRVFDKISYALVMNVVHPLEVGDVVTEP